MLYLIVKNINERYAVFVSLGGAIIILLFACTELSSVFTFIDRLGTRLDVKNEYFSVVLKALAICYLGEFTVGICRDSGQAGWGDKVELACRCTLLVLAIPLFEDFLDVITRLME